MTPIAIAARSTLTVLLMLGGTLTALADPPGRVGRLSYTEGMVSFHAGDQDEWSAAVLNYPVTSGTAFWTEPDSRAEIQIGGAEIRLDQSTELDIVRLDDEGTQLHVGQGVVNVHLRSAPPGGIHILTPHSEAPQEGTPCLNGSRSSCWRARPVSTSRAPASTSALARVPSSAATL
jgi:hypothetical protein